MFYGWIMWDRYLMENIGWMIQLISLAGLKVGDKLGWGGALNWAPGLKVADALECMIFETHLII